MMWNKHKAYQAVAMWLATTLPKSQKILCPGWGTTPLLQPWLKERVIGNRPRKNIDVTTVDAM
eukprot:2653488-Karenia_brevis.AAC.1